MWLSSISGGGGRGHKRHRCLAGPADLAEMRSHAVGDTAERGGGAKLMNVPGALLRGPDGLRQDCRTANGEVAHVGLQAGENAPSARLAARAKGTDVGGQSLSEVNNPSCAPALPTPVSNSAAP